jgi:hypothetical protein
MNGAAEAILEEILRQVTLSNANLAALLRQGAGGGGGGGGGGPPILPPLNAFGAAIKVASIAVGAIAGVFGYLSNIIGGTAKNVLSFGQAMIAGTASLSQLFKVFDQLPIIGKVFSIFGSIVAYQETLLTSYRQLTQAGASFSGSLYDMRDMAFKAYMTLEEFGKVVSDNSSLFSTSIGGVDDGLKTFTASQAKLMDPNGEFGRKLLGLGVTATEAADMLGLYMRMQGNMTKVNTQSSTQIASTTAGLITELDAYAKITGVSRAALEDTMKSAALDENLKRFLSNLNPAQQAAAQAKLAEGLEAGGQGMRDLVAQSLLSQGQITAPLTQASRDLVIQTRGSAMQAAKILYDSSMNNAVGSKESILASIAFREELVKGGKEFSNQFGPNGPGMLGILNLAGAFKSTAELSALINKATNDRELTDEQRAAAIAVEQEKQYKGQVAQLASVEMQLKMFGANLGSGLIPILKKLQPVIDTVTDLLMSSLGGTIKKLTAEGGPIEKIGRMIEQYLVPIINRSFKWFNDTFNTLAETDADDFWPMVGEKLKEAFSNIAEVIGPPLRAMWDAVKPIIINAFKELFEAIKSVLLGPKVTDQNIKSYESQNDMNKSVMSASERISTSIAEFSEGALGLFSEDTAKRISASRIDSDTAAGIADGRLNSSAIGSAMPKRATGSLGMTGNLFENFGKETPVMLHGTEAVVTPPQMEQIMGSGLKDEIRALTNITAQLLQYAKATAENTKRNVDATKGLSGNLFA